MTETVVRVTVGHEAVDVTVTDFGFLLELLRSFGLEFKRSDDTTIDVKPLGEPPLVVIAKICRVYGLDKRAKLVTRSRRMAS